MENYKITKIPVTILTGFLGSGKTTLLNSIIHDENIGKIAVIVNEWGEVGLDNLLVESIDEEIILLGSGCVCCSVRNDLKTSMLDLYDRRLNQEIPVFDRIVVETTGMADPAPVLHALMAEPELTEHYYFDAMICTVDPLVALDNINEYSECKKQIIFSDILVLTKSDISSDEQLKQVSERIQLLNPAAKIFNSHTINPSSLLDSGLYDKQKRQANINRWLNETSYQLVNHKEKHSPDVQNFCIYVDKALSRAIIGMWLADLVRDHGNELLRIKGVVNIEGMVGPMVVHGVQHRLYPPAQLTSWPDSDHTTRIVMIVKGLKKKTVEELLELMCERFAIPA